MGFQLVDYDLLAKYIKESIETEVKSHGLDPKNLRKSLKALYVNHPDRAIQCQYLLAVLSCTNKSETKDKARILNAATYYVREQIYESYQGTVTPYFLVPENSTLFNSLTTSLNLTIDNYPDSKDLLDMYVALGNFMHANVYRDSDSRKGYLALEKQAFSADKIKGYKVEKVLKDLVQKIASLKLEQIDVTKKQQLDKEIPIDQASAAVLFGLFKSSTIASKEISPISEPASVPQGCS